jgi:hypothetical protein
MPKYEKIRNRLVRESQKPAPKPNKLWLVLNSGIFLWVLSASLLTVGGGYVTNHQSCMREAEQLIDRHEKLGREMYARRLAFNKTVADAKTVEQLVTIPSTNGSIYPELEKLPYSELELELRKLNFRVEFDELPDNAITQFREEMRMMLAQFINKSDEAPDPLQSKNPPRKELDKFFSVRKLVSLFLAEQTDFDRAFDTYVLNFQPDCMISKTFSNALGNKPDIIRAAVWHHDDSSDVAVAMKAYFEIGEGAFRQVYGRK